MAIVFNNQNNSIGLGSTNSSGFTTSISINSTGVGIGTTNPTSKLYVVGNSFFTGVVSFTNNNIRIGDVSTGSSITSGIHNFFAGASAGVANTSGSNNFFVGLNAGCNITSGSCNNFLGNSAGQGVINPVATLTAVTFPTVLAAANLTFNNVSATSNGTGSGVLFTVIRNASGAVTNIIITNGGSNYQVGSTLTILGSSVGGSAPGDNITLTINSVGVTGSNNNFFGNQAGKYNTLGSCNNFFGNCAGRSNTTGTNNNFFGLYSGCLNTTGCHNNFFGTSSGRCNTTGRYNNYFGFLSGFNNNGFCNNFIGVGAGRSTTAASNNNFFGLYAGKGFGASITGGDNNFFGKYAGFNFTSGSCNNFLGCQTGFNNSTGNHNNFFGWRAGCSNTSGSNNNFFGQSAGCTQTSGDRNVAIGYSVQLPITTGSDQLVIGSGSTAWITGNITSGNYNVGIGTTNPPYRFTVATSGATATVGLNNVIADFTANTNTYSQINTRNASNGTSASTDIIATADNGTDSSNYIDLGINNSNFADGGWSINGALDGYLYTSDTNLSVGVASNKYLSFFTGGLLNTNERMRITGIGSVGIGTTNPSTNLHVQGNARITGSIADSTGVTGTTGQVLQSTQTGTLWATAAAAGGGGSGTFDTGITTTTFVSVDSGIGTAITGITTVQANNDIFLGPGIALSFPNVVGNRYVIQSIHVANTFDNELYLTARHDFNNGALRVPVANRVVVPYNGALELLEQPTIANPGDRLRLQAFTGIGTTAGGVDGGLDAWITYSTKTDTNFVGVGTTVTTAGTNVGGVSTYQTVYTSTGFPSVIQSIRIANYNLFIDVDASIAIFSSLGIRKGHLAYNLTIPKNSIVELCQQPKRLQASETIGVSVGSTTSGGANCLSVFVSSKYIT
jgi:hypothetical protein